MSAKSRMRQKQMVKTLVEYANDPVELAKKLLVLVDEPDTVIHPLCTTSVQDVVNGIGTMMAAKRMILTSPGEWAKKLLEAAEIGVETTENPVETVILPIETPIEPVAATEIPVELPENVVAVDFPKRRKNRRVYLDMVVDMISEHAYTHAQIRDTVLEQFTALNWYSVNTTITDLKNPKYSVIAERPVGVDDEGKLYFIPVAMQA